MTLDDTSDPAQPRNLKWLAVYDDGGGYTLDAYPDELARYRTGGLAPAVLIGEFDDPKAAAECVWEAVRIGAGTVSEAAAQRILASGGHHRDQAVILPCNPGTDQIRYRPVNPLFPAWRKRRNGVRSRKHDKHTEAVIAHFRDRQTAAPEPLPPEPGLALSPDLPAKALSSVPAEPIDYYAIAKREGPALGMAVSTLHRHLRHTGGDVEQAVERYLKFKADSGSLPVTWQDRTFPSRRACIEWLAAELGVSFSGVQGRLYSCAWDISAVIAYFTKRSAAPLPESADSVSPDPELPFPEPVAPIPGPEPEAPSSPSLSDAPSRRGRHRNSIPVLLGNELFESKVALARHVAGEGALSVAEILALLYPPLDDGLQRRLDYFSNRALRLRGAGEPVSPGPLVYRGRWYPNRAALVRWLAEGLDGPLEEARAILSGLGGDVTGEVEAYCRVFGLIPPGPDPEASLLPSVSAQGSPAPFFAAPVGPKAEAGNGHAGDGIAPPLPAGVETCLAGLDGSEPASQGSDGLATTIAGHIAGIVAAITPTTTTTTTTDIAPLVRHLQDQGEQLARMAARLAQLERVEADKRQAFAAQADTLAVVLHKVNQVAHDLGQMTRPRTPVRHTRARPLGVEPKE